MPEVTQFYKKQRLATLSGIGNLTASDIAAATQGNRELARAGSMLTEFGMNFLQQKEKAQFHDQLNTAKTEYLTKFFKYEQGLQTNADTETYIPNLKAGQTSSYKFTNNRAASEFELWKPNEDLSQTRRVFNIQHSRDVQNYTDNWNLGIKEATRRTSNAMSEADYQLELANGMSFFGLEFATDGDEPILDKEGNPKIQLIEDWENPLLDSDEVRTAGYEGWKADADAKREVKIVENFKAGIEVQAFRIAAADGYEAVEKMLRDPATTASLIEGGMDRKDVRSLINDMSERFKQEKANADEKVEAQREVDRGNVYDAINTGEVTSPDGTKSTDIRKFIESTSLDEDEQEAMWQKSIKETDRRLNGSDIVTDSRIRSQFYKEIPLMLSGAVSRDELLDRANNARFGEMVEGKLVDPTLDEPDYKSVVNAINAQYEQGYGQMMGRVNNFAEGILLKTDSLGFVANAPVRYKQLGDFQQAWFDFVAAKGENLKISDIYPEGRRLAATFQISDTEAGLREDVFEKEQEFLLKRKNEKMGPPLPIDHKEPAKKKTSKKLTPKIARRYLDMTGNDREEAKRLAAEDGYK